MRLQAWLGRSFTLAELVRIFYSVPKRYESGIERPLLSSSPSLPYHCTESIPTLPRERPSRRVLLSGARHPLLCTFRIHPALPAGGLRFRRRLRRNQEPRHTYAPAPPSAHRLRTCGVQSSLRSCLCCATMVFAEKMMEGTGVFLVGTNEESLRRFFVAFREHMTSCGGRIEPHKSYYRGANLTNRIHGQ